MAGDKIRALKKYASKNLTLIVIVSLFIISSLLLLPLYRYSLNPDGVGYLDSALKYARGHISWAVNAYWSPLLSWLLVPFIWLHFFPQTGYFLLATASSASSLAAIHIILRRIISKEYVYSTFMIIAGVTFLSWDLAGPITGDIFAVSAGLWLVIAIDYFLKKKDLLSIFLVALSGALFYFAKSIGFMIFVLTLLVLVALEYRTSGVSKTLKGYLLIGALFLAMCLPWIAAISYKSRTVTFSTAGVEALDLAASTATHYIPLTVSGPYAPPPHDNTPWDDPSTFRKQMADTVKTTEKATLLSNFSHNLLHNLNELISDIGPVFLIVGGMGMYVLFKKAPVIALTLSLISVAMTASYVLTYFDLRYLYFLSATLLIGLAAIIETQTKKVALLGSVLALLLLIYPIQQLQLRENYGRSTYFDAQTVQATIPAASKVLSNDPSVIYYCYYDNLRCYYTVVSTVGLADYIQTHDIHYFLLSKNNNIVAQPNFWQIMHDEHVTVVSRPTLAP